MKSTDKIAVFIMVHGRPDSVLTYHMLKRLGYTGKIYLVADHLDNTKEQYRDIYGDEVIVFNKFDAADYVDAGDNSGDMRSTLYASNEIHRIAFRMGIKYFFIMCDDYKDIYYVFPDSTGTPKPKNLDYIFKIMIKYFEKSNAICLAMAQTGDFIGGVSNENGAYRFNKRKAMNTFLCSTEKPFKFMGRLNEDVTTYVKLGSQGNLFLTIPTLAISQRDTQQSKNGLSEVYADSGTYVKSALSVMYNPSCIKISQVGAKHKRLHHSISWKNAVPMIINEKYKK